MRTDHLCSANPGADVCKHCGAEKPPPWPLIACRHCGQRPEADGDHSCPCPHSDADCLSHR